MKIKGLIDKFHAWQKEPYRYPDKVEDVHQCANCGYEFTGNYCPVCGQKADGGRVTWRWAWKSILNLWGMDSRSLPYTLWQLLLRPGYLISDYISGRRQMCYPPVNMLFVVAIVYTLVENFLNIATVQLDYHEEDYLYNLYVTIDWLQHNPGWGMMLLTMFLIFPTWVLFRFAPRHTRHTLPESIFIQVFMATLMLILSFVIAVTSIWSYLLIPLCYFCCYRQLFGYGVWGTIWRLALSFSVWLVLFIMAICFAIIISDIIDNGFHMSAIVMGSIVIIVTFCIIVAAILAFGYYVGKKQIKGYETH